MKRILLILSIYFMLFYTNIYSKRVIHFGVDGVLQKCIDKSSHLMFDLFKSQGSYTFNARTAIETTSAPSWSNILCGVDSEWSGIISNDWTAPWFTGKKPDITPVSGLDTPILCINQHIKNSNKDKKTLFLTDWDWFVNLGNDSIKDSIDLDYNCKTDDSLQTWYDCDVKITNKAIEQIAEKNFDYMFIYLGQVDETGHAKGFCSEEYIDRLTVVDGLMMSIYNQVKNQDLLDEVTFIWNTDHGARYMEKNHGYQDDQDLIVPWFSMGPGIKKNYEMKNLYKNLDTPAVICKALDINNYELWMSNTPDEIFETPSEYKNSKKLNFLEA